MTLSLSRHRAGRWTRTTLVVSVALLGSGLSMAAPAIAVTTPDPAITGDPNASNGSIVFHDSTGATISAGSDLSHLFDYAEASTNGRSGATKATVYFAFPDHTQSDSQNWNSQQVTASTTFPNAAYPAPLGTSTHPVAKAGSGDANLSTLLTTTTVDTTTGYNQIVQVRLYDSGPGVPLQSTFWATDIYYDTVAGTWQQVYPAPATPATTTATALAADPASSAVQGQSVHLTATVTATDNSAPAGKVQFKDGTANIGSPVTVTQNASNSTAELTTTFSTTGSHTLHAVFSPTNLSAYNGSTGDLPYTIDAATPSWKPSLFGTVRVGSTVYCVASFDYATSVAYSWLNNGVVISGATGSSYKIPESLYTHLLRCHVVATNGAGGPSVSGNSNAATVAIGPALVPTTKPYIYGTVKVGYSVVAKVGAWSPPATSYLYAWYVGSTKVSSSSSYKIPSAYKGKVLSLLVTARRAAWTNGSYKTAGKVIG